MNDNYLKDELYKLIKEESDIFDFIQAGSLDGIWYWDLENTKNEWMSPKFWITLGYDPNAKKHLSSEWQDIIFKEDLKSATENLEKHLTDPSYPYDQIVRYKHQDGSTVWIRCRGIAIRDEKGKPIRMLGAHTDVTKQKQTEVEIKNLSKEYETVFNTTQDAMFLINVDSEKGFLFQRLNQRHKETTGLTTEMVYGKSPRELFGDDLGSKLERNYNECIRTKKPIIYEEELTLSSNTRTWLTTLSPVLKNHQVVQIVGASRDITDRKKAEKELFKEKELLKITLESIGDGVISLDNEHNVIYINDVAEHIIEHKSEEVLNQPLDKFMKLYKENESIDIKSTVENILLSDSAVDILDDVKLEVGQSYKRISGRGSKIKDANGYIEGTVLTLKDETEKLKNQEKLAFLSFHDSLTGLFNRAYFDEELHRLDTSRQLPLSLIVGDVNGLKLSNDVFGHADGDRLLINIARILKECCRYEDIIARWGGDEFAIILPNTNAEDAMHICDRIKVKCEISEPIPIKPSIALGYATKTVVDQEISKILVVAEEMMYRNKLLEGKKVRIEIIDTLQQILEERNTGTIEHCKRLKVLAKSIKYDMQLSDKESEHLYLLAELHDIGTINISKEILLKSGKLNEDEWIEIKKHSEVGYRIAHSTVELVHIADLILTHHEMWDGNGYPQGLKGEQIPRLSRILALLDTYDTITHDRPYRKAKTHSDAINEIRRCSGSQFDPVLADIFIKALDKPLDKSR